MTHEEFKKMERNWEEFYEKCGTCTVFQSFEWNYEWWKREKKGETLFIIQFFRSKPSEILAILPLFIDKTKTIRFIGDIHTDYSDILTLSLNSTDMQDLFSTFAKIVYDTPHCRNIVLKNLNQNLLWIGSLHYVFDYKKLFYNSNAFSYLNIVPNKKNFFSSLIHLKTTQKRTLKRIYKKYSDNYTNRIHKYPADMPYTRMSKLINSMKSQKKRDASFMSEQLLEIVCKMYEKKYLIIHETMDSEGKPIAMNLILVSQGNRYTLWIDLYKDIRYINIFSYILLLEHLNNHTDKEFCLDFGRGIYDYKIKNFHPNIENQYTFVYSKNLLNYLYILCKAIFRPQFAHIYKKYIKKSI